MVDGGSRGGPLAPFIFYMRCEDSAMATQWRRLLLGDNSSIG